jgi:hypothetical protein
VSWLQYAVRSLRPRHQAHFKRNSGGLRELYSIQPMISSTQLR